VAVSPPQSSFAQISCSSSFDNELTYPGSLPSSRHCRSASTVTKVAKPSLRSVLRFSQPLDGFLRPPALRAYSIPQPRPGLSPFRGFSPRADRRSHRAPLPPCRCPHDHCSCWPIGFAYAIPSEIAELRAHEASTSRLYSARGRVAYGLGISLTAPRSPLRFFLLQVVNHRLRLQFTRSHPPTTFVPFGAVLGVLQRRARFLELPFGRPKFQPARDFRAFRLKSPW
jgi:hypothetical protein